MDARDHFPVDAAGHGSFRLPVLLLLFGGAADVRQEAVLAAELGQQELSNGLGHLIIAPAITGDAVFLGQGSQPVRTSDLISFRRPLRGQQ